MHGATRHRGHRLASEPGAAALEAWAPTREACLEEAARALVASIARVDDATWWWHRRVSLPGPADEQLVTLLDAILAGVRADASVPVHVHVHAHGHGAIADLWLTDRHRLTPTGAAAREVRGPVALREEAPGRWRATVGMVG
jgi:SHS2 domain-containing protein